MQYNVGVQLRIRSTPLGRADLLQADYLRLFLNKKYQSSKYVPQWYVQDYKLLFAVMPKGHWVFNLITIALRQIFIGGYLKQSYVVGFCNLISHSPTSAS